MGSNAARKGISDADLVAKATLLCGSTRAVAKRMQVGERPLRAVQRGGELPPRLRSTLLQFVRRKGAVDVPLPPAQQGRRPSSLPGGGNMRVPLRPEEILAFEAQADLVRLTAGDALTCAVRLYLDAHPVFDRGISPVEENTLGYRCRMDLGVLKKLNRWCVFLGWRRVCLRAAVLEWTTHMEQKGSRRHGQDLRAVA